jgi:hypothetical protein
MNRLGHSRFHRVRDNGFFLLPCTIRKKPKAFLRSLLKSHFKLQWDLFNYNPVKTMSPKIQVGDTVTVPN